MIGETEAKWLNCKVVVEAANAPTTPPAERLLLERGVAILPAILCNCGGVTVSYLEWKQNRQAEQWTDERVDGELRRHMKQAASLVAAAAREHGCDLRRAAYIAALENLGRVYEIRGIFP